MWIIGITIVKDNVWRAYSSLLMSFHFFHSTNKAKILYNIRQEDTTVVDGTTSFLHCVLTCRSSST